MALYEMSAGQTTVSTNASMVACLAARTLVLQAHPANTVNIQVGTSGVQSLQLSGLTLLTLAVSHAGQVYAKTSAGSATLLWIAYSDVF